MTTETNPLLAALDHLLVEEREFIELFHSRGGIYTLILTRGERKYVFHASTLEAVITQAIQPD
jgi:hypothetical protein